MDSEKDKMLAGYYYDAFDPELVAARERARQLCLDLAQLREDQTVERAHILEKLLGEKCDAIIRAPFFCDYGTNIELGKGVYFNFNCVVLDVSKVRIGDHVLCGPNVQIYTAGHPLDTEKRRAGLEFGKEITIGDDVWIGGSAIICPGVKIGSRSIIGAGSVVTKDIPSDVVAAGNPCRVLRTNLPEH